MFVFSVLFGEFEVVEGEWRENGEWRMFLHTDNT